MGEDRKTFKIKDGNLGEVKIADEVILCVYYNRLFPIWKPKMYDFSLKISVRKTIGRILVHIVIEPVGIKDIAVGAPL